MAIILDAAVVIQGEKGLFGLNGWLAANANEQFELAAITVAELWHGVERATPRQRARRMNYVNVVTSAMPIIPYTEQTAYEHARIWAYLEKKGKMIDAHDLIVAATALQRQSQVATLNRKHFEQIPGLKVIVP